MFAKYCVSALLWASSFHLQIWTLEALGKAPDEPGDLASAIQAITGQLGLNATLFHVLGLLSLLSIH